jgi:hypothetical protein
MGSVSEIPGRVRDWVEGIDLQYDLPAREPRPDLISEWAEDISETEGEDEFYSLAEEFYSEVEDELEADVLGYNMGLAAGKAEEYFSLEERSRKALRTGLWSSAKRRGEDTVKVVDLFEYGVDDFEELREEYGL